jgi:hypothetical protein
MQAKVALVAKDAGESRQLRDIELELNRNGVKTKSLLGHGGTFPATQDTLEELVEWSTLTLVAMSNDTVMELLTARYAARTNKLAFFTNGYQNMAFCEMRPFAQLLIYTTGESERIVRKTFPVPTRLARIGNSMWEEWGQEDMPSREEARTHFEVKDDELLACLSLDKYTGWNFEGYANSVRALEIVGLTHGTPVKIITGFHPGDPFRVSPDDYQGDEERRAELQYMLHALRERLYREFFEQIADIEVVLTKPDGLSLRQAVPGADIVIGAVSTFVLEAGAFRIPAISIRSHPVERLLTKGNGCPKWLPYDNLGKIFLRDRNSPPKVLARKIRTLLTEDGFSSMRRQQEKIFPGPFIPGTSARNAASAVMKLL